MTEQDWKHKCQQITISLFEELRNLQTWYNHNVCICGLFHCVLNESPPLRSNWSLQLSSSIVGGPRGHLGTVPMLIQKQSDNSTKYALKEVS